MMSIAQLSQLKRKPLIILILILILIIILIIRIQLIIIIIKIRIRLILVRNWETIRAKARKRVATTTQPPKVRPTLNLPTTKTLIKAAIPKPTRQLEYLLIVKVI